MGNEQSKQSRQKQEEIEARRKEASGPVKVPGERRQRGPDTQFEPAGPARDIDYVPLSNLNFPPRLPLPIGEEDHTPGSPIITPADISSVLNDDEVDGVLPRQISVLSSTTADDDDVAGDELQPYPFDGSKRTVPTTLRWKQGGDRIYVTGTFTSWSRKFRMHRDSDTNVPTAILQLPPGTHHVKFIVDGDMQISNELPTAVDYNNILVNYIEVSADDIPSDQPTATGTVPDGVYPPLVLPPGTEAKDHAPDSVGKTQSLEGDVSTKPVFWGGKIPEYLFDLEQPEETKRFQRANRGATDFATPPNIPVFLQKLILNGTTPMKDDNSVLNMPNHTVLNHLATSSIKNQVLATSVTTRYKRKYVTTMMYKPTDDKPTDDKPTDDKPTDDKPTDDKPTDDKPTDDKAG
ncbi:MAG: hypothetical protein LQ349_000332 [Xanthoria aureola]|nr:MAG: hypothetical protein LQ349_000332 [Xanthoria aureola]